MMSKFCRRRVVLLFSVLLAALAAGCSLPRPETGLADGGARFVLQAPRAKKVALVGDFNHWDRGKDLLDGPDQNGAWSKIVPLPPGRYEYLFLIDGKKWTLDPAMPAVADGLGGRNSVLFVASQE